MITQAQSEFELHARAILGFPVSTGLRNPGASAVIYGQIEGEGIAFEGVGDALSVPETEIRLFGKPISYPRRRVGVALAAGNSIEEARERAKKAAGLIKPLPG
jgi:phosphoribosylglycinamide formyltransferase 2